MYINFLDKTFFIMNSPKIIAGEFLNPEQKHIKCFITRGITFIVTKSLWRIPFGGKTSRIGTKDSHNKGHNPLKINVSKAKAKHRIFTFIESSHKKPLLVRIKNPSSYFGLLNM